MSSGTAKRKNTVPAATLWTCSAAAARSANKAEEWRETVENFRPAAEEAAVRDEEASRFIKFGANGPGFMSV